VNINWPGNPSNILTFTWSTWEFKQHYIVLHDFLTFSNTDIRLSEHFRYFMISNKITRTPKRDPQVKITDRFLRSSKKPDIIKNYAI